MAHDDQTNMTLVHCGMALDDAETLMNAWSGCRSARHMMIDNYTSSHGGCSNRQGTR